MIGGFVLNAYDLFVGQPGGPPQAARSIANGPPHAATAAGAQPRGPAAQGAPQTYKFQTAGMRPTAQAMQPQQPASQSAAPAVHIQGQEPLSASALAAAHPSDQKQMLGERLFPLIHVSENLKLIW